MSRVAKKPIELPSGVEISVKGQALTVKGGKGSLDHQVHRSVKVEQDGNVLTFAPKDGSKSANALAGTTRALVNNMVTGVSVGFEKKLQLVGVGYRAQAQGSKLNLSLVVRQTGLRLPEIEGTGHLPQIGESTQLTATMSFPGQSGIDVTEAEARDF